ncbi:MAG: LTA synthase family protein [Oscillospiraceae bacterium]|nr:LTA synthase family protein [Oscillospiraceae bacterium]
MLKKFLARRNSNSHKYKKLNIVLILITPLYLLLMTELNQCQSFFRVGKFIISSTSVFLFSLLIVSLIYAALLFFTKKLYVTALIMGLGLFTLSCIEYFKYVTTGMHFILPDFILAPNAGELIKFARIVVPVQMVLIFISFLAYVGVCYYLKPAINVKLRYSLPIGAGVLILFAIVVATPVSGALYRYFNVIDAQNANAMTAKRRFENNELVAFLTTDISDKIENIMRKPTGYSEQKVKTALLPGENSVQSLKPNIIIILNESHTDLRIHGEKIPDGVYDGYDKARANSVTGITEVPTYGGYTVRTEFELLHGLPVKSTGNSIAPHGLLRNRSHPTIARYLSDNGYNSVFIHPFNDITYDRGKAYSYYGFDSLKFDGQLDVSIPDFYGYADDNALYDQIIFEMKTSSKPSFIFVTTMQNHLPYTDEKLDEYEFYLRGIQHTNNGLGEFISRLENFEQDTLLLFMGDHLPYFSDINNFYDRNGLSTGDMQKIYEQQYLVYNNFGLNVTLPQNKISTFFLPYVLIDNIGLPKSPLIATMLDKMNKTPVYSTSTGFDDELLDMLTYDRIKGGNYAARTPLN